MDGLYWPSVEHFYHAAKFPGRELAEKIRLAKYAIYAKRLGNRTPRPDWKEIREDVMTRGLRAKFAAHEDIRLKLIDTGSVVLLHRSIKDVYWGVGLDGNGLNRMGVLLMELRTKLLSGSSSPLYSDFGAKSGPKPAL